MSFNSDRLNDYNSKSFNVTNYIDYDRFKNYRKINIDYTFSNNNEVITRGPVFNPVKIVANRVNPAYTNGQDAFESDSFRNNRLTQEYNKIR
jgi:hypothetical protein